MMERAIESKLGMNERRMSEADREKEAKRKVVESQRHARILHPPKGTMRWGAKTLHDHVM
jgi:hypothetical protein